MAEQTYDAKVANDAYNIWIGMLRDGLPVDWFKLDEVVGERLAHSAREVANAVLRLHSRRNFDGDGYGWSVCAEDRQTWPCATVVALADVLGDDGVKG